MYGKALAGAAAALGMKVAIEFRQVSGRKEARICDTLEPALGSHSVVFNTAVARDKKLCEQITHLSREPGSLAHDDRVEALEGVVWALSSALFRDQDQALEDLDKQEWAHEMKTFVEMAVGSPTQKRTKQSSWITSRRRRR